MLRTLIVIIVMVWVIMQLIVRSLNMIMIKGIVECQEILTLQIEEDLMKGHQENEDRLRKKERSCVISVTTLDT